MSIEAMKQALEAWQTSVYGSDRHHKAMLVVMTNMGQAIAEAETQEQGEPVAWPCVIEEDDFEKDTVTLKMQCSDYKVSAGQHWLSTCPQPNTTNKPLAWICEDELPVDYPFDAMYPYSKVDVVRMFPVFGPQPNKPLTGWKPIETAPRDGTEILMTNGVDVSSGQWFSGNDGTCDQDGSPNGDERDAGWIDWSGGMQPDPNHWMSLPTPPIKADRNIKRAS